MPRVESAFVNDIHGKPVLTKSDKRAKQTSIPPYLRPLFSYRRVCECLPEAGVSGYAPGATRTGDVLRIQWVLKLFSRMFDGIWHEFSFMYICSSSKGLLKGCNGSFSTVL